MALKIQFIADDMFPKTSLPNASLLATILDLLIFLQNRQFPHLLVTQLLIKAQRAAYLSSCSVKVQMA